MALIGAPDCGSELIMSCLVGNVRPTAGSIEIDKNALTQLSLEHYRIRWRFLALTRGFSMALLRAICAVQIQISAIASFEEALKISGLGEVIDAYLRA